MLQRFFCCFVSGSSPTIYVGFFVVWSILRVSLSRHALTIEKSPKRRLNSVTLSSISPFYMSFNFRKVWRASYLRKWKYTAFYISVGCGYPLIELLKRYSIGSKLSTFPPKVHKDAVNALGIGNMCAKGSLLLIEKNVLAAERPLSLQYALRTNLRCFGDDGRVVQNSCHHVTGRVRSAVLSIVCSYRIFSE